MLFSRRNFWSQKAIWYCSLSNPGSKVDVLLSQLESLAPLSNPSLNSGPVTPCLSSIQTRVSARIKEQPAPKWGKICTIIIFTERSYAHISPLPPNQVFQNGDMFLLFPAGLQLQSQLHTSLGSSLRSFPVPDQHQLLFLYEARVKENDCGQM